MKRRLKVDVEFTPENTWIYMNKKIKTEKQFSNIELSLNTITINTDFLKFQLMVK
jgi:hypothetical protein